MGKRAAQKPEVTCADCIHEWACQAWNVGHIHDMDASNCSVRETVRESSAYFIGFMEGRETDGNGR